MLVWIVRYAGSFRWDLSSEIGSEIVMNRSQDLILWAGFFFSFFFSTDQSRKWLLECTVSGFLVLRESEGTHVNGYILSRMGLWWRKNRVWGEASLDGRRVNQNSAVLTCVSRPFRSTTINRVSFVFVSKDMYVCIYISVLLRSFVFIFVIINSCETT